MRQALLMLISTFDLVAVRPDTSMLIESTGILQLGPNNVVISSWCVKLWIVTRHTVYLSFFVAYVGTRPHVYSGL